MTAVRPYWSLDNDTDREWIFSSSASPAGVIASAFSPSVSCRSAPSTVSALWAKTPSTHS
jgi:hypothetical protein